MQEQNHQQNYPIYLTTLVCHNLSKFSHCPETVLLILNAVYDFFAGLVYQIRNHQILMVPKTLPNPDNLQIVKVSVNTCKKILLLFSLSLLNLLKAKKSAKAPNNVSIIFIPRTLAAGLRNMCVLALIFHHQKYILIISLWVFLVSYRWKEEAAHQKASKRFHVVHERLVSGSIENIY